MTALRVGIPREIKSGEKRVGLTPQGVQSLTEAGIRVLVQSGAGEGSGFSDQEYQKAGAEIIAGARDLYLQSELIKKVKEPVASERDYLRPELIIFSYLHLASPHNRDLLQRLIDQKVTAIGLETMEKGGRAIGLEPMSEIAGTVAAYLAGFFRHFVRIEKGAVRYPRDFLQRLNEAARHFPEFPEPFNPGLTVIFGGGTVGRNTALGILKMGGEVELIEKRKDRRDQLSREFKPFGAQFRAWGLQDEFRERLKEADCWIGSVHVVGEKAPLVLSSEELRTFSREKTKLILDIAVDQGGNFPETRPTTYENPLYLDSAGNLRFGVQNIPSLCGQAASEALEKMSPPYTLRLAKDWKRSLGEFPELAAGVQVFGGQLVHPAVASAHQMPWKPFEVPE